MVNPGHWKAVGASSTGKSHASTNSPCQDSFYLEYIDSITSTGVVAAVADGAGSARRSKEGSALVVKTYCDKVQERIAELQLTLTQVGGFRTQDLIKANRYAFRQARQALEDLSVKDDCNLAEFATTLVGVIATEHHLVVTSIGDGFVVARVSNQKEYKKIANIARGEYANETTFVTSEIFLKKGFLNNNTIAWNTSAGSVFISSDGLLRLAIDMKTEKPHEGFFNPLDKFSAQVLDPEAASNSLREFLQSAKVQSRTDDDCTLLIIRNY